jgi:hypothetical protein
MEHRMVQQSATALQVAKQAEYIIAKDLDKAKEGSAPSRTSANGHAHADRGSAAHV